MRGVRLHYFALNSAKSVLSCNMHLFKGQKIERDTHKQVVWVWSRICLQVSSQLSILSLSLSLLHNSLQLLAVQRAAVYCRWVKWLHNPLEKVTYSSINWVCIFLLMRGNHECCKWTTNQVLVKFDECAVSPGQCSGQVTGHRIHARHT